MTTRFEKSAFTSIDLVSWHGGIVLGVYVMYLSLDRLSIFKTLFAGYKLSSRRIRMGFDESVPIGGG